VSVALTALPAQVLSSWATRCLVKSGLPNHDAAFVAGALTQTSLWGIDSHGIARLPHYLSRLAAGSLEANPELTFRRTGPCTGDLHGGHVLGLMVMRAATQECITIAQEAGVGMVGVRESSHCGAIGIYGRMIAEAGLIGVVFTHSDAFVAPHLGNRKQVGTNPLCITVPRGEGPPLCLDMATSCMPWNAVVNARRDGELLPEGMAFDEEGNPTQDPDRVACLRPMAGHKGWALAFMIDLLCGPLNGMPFGLHIPPMYGNLEARRHLGSLVVAIDPRCFFGGTDFQARVEEAVQEARAAGPLDSNVPVQTPGDDHEASEKLRSEAGIPVSPELLAELDAWAARLDIPSISQEPIGKTH